MSGENGKEVKKEIYTVKYTTGEVFIYVNEGQGVGVQGTFQILQNVQTFEFILVWKPSRKIFY